MIGRMGTTTECAFHVPDEDLFLGGSSSPGLPPLTPLLVDAIERPLGPVEVTNFLALERPDRSVSPHLPENPAYLWMIMEAGSEEVSMRMECPPDKTFQVAVTREYVSDLNNSGNIGVEVTLYWSSLVRQGEHRQMTAWIPLSEFGLTPSDLEEGENVKFHSSPQSSLYHTNFRVWRTPLRVEEILAHFRDPLSSGTQFPVDEIPSALDVPSGVGEFTYNPENEGGAPPLEARPFSSKNLSPLSRSRPQLLSSWDSFSLRGSPEEWRDSVTEENVQLSGSGDDATIFDMEIEVTSIDTHLDESVAVDRVRIWDGTKTEVFASEQPVSDWRFAIEYSPTQALDTDIMRAFTDQRAFDDWVGAPEAIWSRRYLPLEDFASAYFGRVLPKDTLRQEIKGRVAGPIRYLEGLKLHRWVSASLHGLIEEMLPFNVSYFGFNAIIEPLATERFKIAHWGGGQYMDPQDQYNLSLLYVRFLSGQLEGV